MYHLAERVSLTSFSCNADTSPSPAARTASFDDDAIVTFIDPPPPLISEVGYRIRRKKPPRAIFISRFAYFVTRGGFLGSGGI